MEPVDVRRAVPIRMVIPEAADDMYDYHTHGLEVFSHPEFQALAPGYYRRAAVALLQGHADAILNRGERFVARDTFELDGVTCGHEQVAGDVEGDPPRVRILDRAGGCNCELCSSGNKGEQNHDDANGQDECPAARDDSQCVLPNQIRLAIGRIEDQLFQVAQYVRGMAAFQDQAAMAKHLFLARMHAGIPRSFDERRDRSEYLGAYLRKETTSVLGAQETKTR